MERGNRRLGAGPTVLERSHGRVARRRGVRAVLHPRAKVQMAVRAAVFVVVQVLQNHPFAYARWHDDLVLASACDEALCVVGVVELDDVVLHLVRGDGETSQHAVKHGFECLAPTRVLANPYVFVVQRDHGIQVAHVDGQCVEVRQLADGFARFKSVDTGFQRHG